MSEENTESTVQRLTKKIQQLEDELSKSNSEKGEIQAELKKLKDELEDAEGWLL